MPRLVREGETPVEPHWQSSRVRREPDPPVFGVTKDGQRPADTQIYYNSFELG
ncbi:MAG: hypothetical protein O2960_14865 [Verrucomicrobia bacterium]|nr:hypothetical protein [Verrucomicrobiota bacterium]